MADTRSSAYDHREGKAKPPKLRSLEISEAEGGGHLVEHHMDYSGGAMPMERPKPHVFGADEGKALLDHLAEHLNIKPIEGAGEAEKDEY